MIARILTVLAAAALLASCADDEPPPEIPMALRPVVECLYYTVRATPRVTNVGIYMVQNGPIVEYAWNDRDDEEARTDLYISGPTRARRFLYETGTLKLDNPVSAIATTLAQRCKADAMTFGKDIAVSNYEGRTRVYVEPPPASGEGDGFWPKMEWPKLDFWPFN